MPDDTPTLVDPDLDEIADRLWSGNAAVVVGAGFSQNASPVDPKSAPFPSWQDLGDVFYEKLHGRRPGKEAKYMSLLKMAEQVEAAFGRFTLNKLLMHEIPDLTYEPSPLHSQLLNLPWNDVFTTNYDTGPVAKICRSCRGCGLAPSFFKILAGSRFAQAPLHAGTSTRSSSLARSRRLVRQDVLRP